MITVLIVDDDRDMADLLRGALELGGLRCVWASTVAEVAGTAESGPAYAYLIDLMLRNQSGIELAQELRETGIEAPIIAMSASPYLADLARETGLFESVVEKPFDLDEVLLVVSEAIAEVSAAGARSFAL